MIIQGSLKMDDSTKTLSCFQQNSVFKKEKMRQGNSHSNKYKKRLLS